MALTKDKIGEIAMKVLQDQMERKGLPMNPKEIKRDVHNEARNFGCTPAEFAEFAKLIYNSAFERLIAELDRIIANNPDDKVKGR